MQAAGRKGSIGPPAGEPPPPTPREDFSRKFPASSLVSIPIVVPVRRGGGEDGSSAGHGAERMLIGAIIGIRSKDGLLPEVPLALKDVEEASPFLHRVAQHMQLTLDSHRQHLVRSRAMAFGSLGSVLVGGFEAWLPYDYGGPATLQLGIEEIVEAIKDAVDCEAVSLWRHKATKLVREHCVVGEDEASLGEIFGVYKTTRSRPRGRRKKKILSSKELDSVGYQVAEVGQGLAGFCGKTQLCSNDILSWKECRSGVRDMNDRFDPEVDLPPGIPPKPMSCLCIPILSPGGTPLGVLQLMNKRGLYGSRGSFSPGDIEFSTWVTRLLAARIHPSSTRKAVTDSLIRAVKGGT